ncbi:MAG: tetratricopeptide repeat protein, partial [Chitinophagaceae bacterium]|nr:tetratricopeptide repeat protein [Chitinophagaceae bacterium]
MRIHILLLGFFAFLISFPIQAQEPGRKLQETAKTMLMQGDFENAIAILESASKQAPGDLSILKDLSYACYLKRDFAKAIQVGRPLSERQDADEQVFQILGLSYKAIAAYKDGIKLYKNALKKFPNSTIIYNEYGELLAMDNSPDEAIEQWERGIQVDPNFSGNYYNACIYYTKKGNWIRMALYGEIFINLESFTARTAEVKKAVLNAWQKLFLPTIISQQLKSGLSSFEKAVLQILEKQVTVTKTGFQVDNSTSLRSQFILEWFKSSANTFPFRLFEQQQY